MADVNISKYRASVVRSGSTPATPGFVVSEGQNPVEPAGSEQNHLPVTINATATGLAITTDQVLSGAGTVGQYIRGDGSLADFPASTGGGSSVSYYLNGSISQGTISGVAYKELSKVPILGTGTDFTINANGYIAQFLTDAGDPNLLEIPGGNWNFETYFSASSGGGSPTFYVELYKYDGSTFTLIASNSGNPELIAFGTNVTSYFSTLAVPTTALTLTDRLAIRYYVTHSGRTITLHTENNHLCQVITTFTTGLTALNGLTAQVQYFAVGTSGTDFNIASATQTHTFNLPTASATNRGALSSADWSTFNAKQNALTLTTSGSSGASTLVGATLNVPTYTLSGLGGVPTSRQLTINGTAFDLSADRSWSVGTVTSVGLSSATSGVTIGNTPVTGSGTITLAIATATSTQQGLLSSTDWSTFNNKQNALTLTTTGTSGAATLVGATLNIPQYQAAGTYVTSVTASSPLASSGGTTPNITIQQASGSQSGFLSSTDWTTFNNKQNALTNPVTGTGTTNYLPKFTGSTTIGNSQIFDNGTNVGIGTASPNRLLTVSGTQGLIALNATSFRNTTIGSDSVGNFIVYDDTAAAYRMVINSSGNVGIGTSSPTFRLDVQNNTQAIARVLDTSTNASLIMQAGSGSAMKVTAYNYASSTALPLYIQVDGANTIMQAGGGNLLVGTTTDNGARLQVSGTATFSSTVTSNGAGFIIQGDQQYRMNGYNSGYSYMTTNAGFNGNYNGVGIFSNATNANSLPAWLLDLGGLDGPTRGITDAFVIARKASGGSWNNYLAINASGNVGIGTSSPGYKLDVQNGSDFDIRLRDTSLGGTVGILFETGNNFSGTSQAFIKGIGAGNSGVSQLIFGTATNVGDTTASEKMRITSSGNVGIGTSSPSDIINLAGGASGSYGLVIDNSKVGGGVKAHFQYDADNQVASVAGITTNGLVFKTLTSGNVTEKMRITSGGNVSTGNGYTFTSWSNTGNIDLNDVYLSLSSSGSYGGIVANNAYFNSGWKYKAANNATLYQTLGGEHRFLTAGVGSGAGAAISFTQAMTLTSGGNLLIGTTTDNSHKLRVNGTGYFDTGIKTGNPVGSTTNDWLLGRALVSGTSTPDRWIRVQIGNLYYDILAVYMGSV